MTFLTGIALSFSPGGAEWWPLICLAYAGAAAWLVKSWLSSRVPVARRGDLAHLAMRLKQP